MKICERPRALGLLACIAALLPLGGCRSAAEPDYTEVVISGSVVTASGAGIPFATATVWLRHPCGLCVNTFTESATTDGQGRFSVEYRPEVDTSGDACFDDLMRVGVHASAAGFEEGEIEQNLCSGSGGPSHPVLVLTLTPVGG